MIRHVLIHSYVCIHFAADEHTIDSIASGKYVRLVLSPAFVASVKRSWQERSRQRVAQMQQRLGRLRSVLRGIGSGGDAPAIAGGGGGGEVDTETVRAFGVLQFLRVVAAFVTEMRGGGAPRARL